MNLKSNLSGLTALLCFVLAGWMATAALAHFPIPPKKGEIGKKALQARVPNFSLTNQDDKTFRFSDARGKTALVTFIYTACPDVCPLLAAKLAAIQRALDRKHREDYLLLSITTDPERDTSEALKSYGKRFGADFNRWHFLTGSRTELAKVWKIFEVTVEKHEDGQVWHTGLTTLIDRNGVRRIDYFGDQWADKEVLKDFAAIGSVPRGRR